MADKENDAFHFEEFVDLRVRVQKGVVQRLLVKLTNSGRSAFFLVKDDVINEWMFENPDSKGGLMLEQSLDDSGNQRLDVTVVATQTIPGPKPLKKALSE